MSGAKRRKWPLFNTVFLHTCVDNFLSNPWFPYLCQIWIHLTLTLDRDCAALLWCVTLFSFSLSAMKAEKRAVMIQSFIRMRVTYVSPASCPCSCVGWIVFSWIGRVFCFVFYMACSLHHILCYGLFVAKHGGSRRRCRQSRPFFILFFMLWPVVSAPVPVWPHRGQALGDRPTQRMSGRTAELITRCSKW